MDNRERRQMMGDEIARRRAEQGISQRKLALMIGSNQNEIWKIESGQVSVGIDMLCRIADALDTYVYSFIKF